MENLIEQYKYYAFLSYSHENGKAAKHVHTELEHFRVPVKYVAEENRPDNKFIRPVFRDKRDLKVSERNFAEDITPALEQSRYLIVLCSPEAANSDWVNKEVKAFLASHDNDYKAIVPLILSGSPGKGGENECLPPALRCPEITGRNLPTMIPDVDEKEKVGWENGVVDAMSYMLKVDREKIKATVDAERIRQIKIYVVIGIVATLLSAWALHAERRAAANAEEAKKLQKLAQKNEAENKALAIRIMVVATRYNNDGQNYFVQGKYSKALENYQKALAIYIDIFGDDHSDVATSYNNIGQVYYNQGKYTEALEYYQKSLAIRIKKFGVDHSDVATSYNNIGYVYSNQGKYREALVYFQKALAIYIKKLGADHPDVAISYNTIGLVYSKQGKYSEALENYQKALAIRIKQLGSNHPSVAISYNNIGFVYDRQGNYSAALENHQKALDIARKTLGEQHSSTKFFLKNIESVKGKLKR